MVSPRRRQPSWDQFRVRATGALFLAVGGLVFFTRDTHPALPWVLLATAGLAAALAARDWRELQGTDSWSEDDVPPPS